jgi:hypothetical protein
MRVLILAAAMAALVSPAFATPSCDGPDILDNGLKNFGFGPMTESEAAAIFEQQLNHEGIRAHQTRFWSNCIQTWVNENGKETMEFFDPDTLRRIPVN